MAIKLSGTPDSQIQWDRCCRYSSRKWAFYQCKTDSSGRARRADHGDFDAYSCESNRFGRPHPRERSGDCAGEFDVAIALWPSGIAPLGEGESGVGRRVLMAVYSNPLPLIPIILRRVADTF